MMFPYQIYYNNAWRSLQFLKCNYGHFSPAYLNARFLFISANKSNITLFVQSLQFLRHS